LHALQGEYPDITINYQAVKVSRGDLPPAINPTVLAMVTGLQFNWEFDPEADF
jgi:hypothetical protein